MKNLIILGLIGFLLFSAGCVTGTIEEELEKEKEGPEIVTGNITKGEELEILNGNFAITPPEGWFIRSTKGTAAHFVLKKENRENLFKVILYKKAPAQYVRVFNNQVEVKEELEPGLKKYLGKLHGASEPDAIFENIDGISTQGFQFQTVDNMTHENIYSVLFIYIYSEHLIEFSFSANEDDFNTFSSEVLEAISTFRSK